MARIMSGVVQNAGLCKSNKIQQKHTERGSKCSGGNSFAVQYWNSSSLSL